MGAPVTDEILAANDRTAAPDAWHSGCSNSARMHRLLFTALTVAFLLATGCTSDDTPTPDAGGGGGADAGASADADPASPDAAGLLPFMSMCENNEDCESNLCFNFNAKGPHCTHACTVDADCEAPSPGCSGMGVCKTPDQGSGGGGGGGGGVDGGV